MPDNPVTAKWLNERERAIAVKRVADHQLGVKNSMFESMELANNPDNQQDHFKWEQVKEAVTDYQFWMIVLQMFFSQAAGNVTTNFLGIIIKVGPRSIPRQDTAHES